MAEPDVPALIYAAREETLKRIADELGMTHLPAGHACCEFLKNGRPVVHAKANENGMEFDIDVGLGAGDLTRIRDTLKLYTPEGNRFSYRESKESVQFLNYTMPAGRFASWKVL